MGFIVRIRVYVKKHGIRGFIKRVFKGQGKLNPMSMYKYIVDREEIPFSKEDYEQYKDKGVILNWIIPEMGKGSGGHINIFRFVSYLERNGIHNRVYLFNPPKLKDDKAAREFAKKHFQILDERVEVYADANEAKFAHGIIATSWQTAYFVRRFDNCVSKFYFVQDYEPYFYPLGSEYEFALQTYSFGLRGITAGDWLKKICNEQFGMSADSFGFSYDKKIYIPKEKKDDIKRVFFYARPVTPRRDFELGMLALDELSKRVKGLEVVFAGWDVSEFEIPFHHRNEGIVNIENLADLYSQCDMCLIISNTNLSLLPLEVMASNSVAVCSKGDNSSWLVNEDNSIMVDCEPFAIADTMEYYLNHPSELARIREKGLAFAQGTSWDIEGEKVKQSILEGIKEDGK